MTGRQKLEAEEQRQELFGAATWHCVVCSGPLAVHGTAQLAHRIAQTKARLLTHGKEIMHNSLNLVPVCSLRCNDRANIGNRPMEARALIDRITRVVTGREPAPDMREEYARLREEFMGVKQ